VDLLADAFEVFGNRDRMSSDDLVKDLIALEGQPWAEMGKMKKPLSKTKLAQLLKPFGIVPGTIRLDHSLTAKGYVREAFVDAWKRYL
jgi:hypothetical protein